MYRRVHGTDMIQRDGLFIPPDPNNRDYQEFIRSGAQLLDPEVIPDVSEFIDIQSLLEAIAELLNVPPGQIVALARQKASRR